MNELLRVLSETTWDTLVVQVWAMIAGIRLARERQVNVRVVPTRTAIEESVDLAHEIYNRVFRKVPDKMEPMGH